MRYVIVDLDGASRDYFDTLDGVVSALREAEGDLPGAATGLYVVAYDNDGNRLAPPARGDEWLSPFAQKGGQITTGANTLTERVESAMKSGPTAGASTEPPRVPA